MKTDIRKSGVNPVEELEDIDIVGSNIEDFDAPLFIVWQLNSACNLDCLHCCEDAGHKMPDEFTRDEAIDFCRQSLKDIWKRYKKAWKEEAVVDFTKRVINDPKLLCESNK